MQLIDNLNEIPVDQDLKLASFDISNMYSNLPTKDLIPIITTMCDQQNLPTQIKLEIISLTNITEMLYYVIFDELFNVIHEAHIAVGHGGRIRMIKELNRKYKNVTVESIVTYLRLF
jgi:hypothetical protein